MCVAHLEHFSVFEVLIKIVGEPYGEDVASASVDCERPLPSNHTLVSKLGLVRRTQPLLVLASGGNRPKQLPASAVGSAYAVTAYVKPKVEPTVHRVASTQHLQAIHPRPARDTPQAPHAPVFIHNAGVLRRSALVPSREA